MSAVPIDVVARVASRCFTSDNTAGGPPEVIAAVAAAASGQAGTDNWTLSARHRFSEIFDCDVDLLPVSTGSAANALSGRWEPNVVRFVPSIATTTHDVDELVHAVRRLTVATIEESRSERARTQRSTRGRRSDVACIGHVR